MKRVWLKEIREDEGLTQKELGEIIGITRQAYTSIETGIRNPSLEVALKLSSLLEFDPVLFLDEGVTQSNR